MPASRSRRATEGGRAAAPVDERGFLLAPRAVWIDPGIPAGAPDVTLVPAYGRGAYVVTDEIRRPDVTRAAIDAFGWDPVRITTKDGANDGLVHAAGRGYTRYGCGWCTGLTGDTIDSIDRIGRIRFDPDARLGTKLRYAEVLAWIRPEVWALRQDGARVSFDIRVAPDGRPPEIPDTAAALALLVQAGVMGRGHKPSQAVAAYSIETPAVRRLPNLDRMRHDQVRAFYAEPWPTITVTVTARDPRQLRKRAAFRPFPLRPDANWRE